MRSTDPDMLKMLRGLWVSMAGIYGAERWSRSFGDSPEREPGSGRLTATGRQWAATLAGLSRTQIRAGLSATRFTHSPWLPGAPEFRARCLAVPRFATVQAVFKDPDMADAATAAFCRGMWQLLDGYRLRNASQRDALQMLRDAYDATCEAVMRGDKLPPPPKTRLARKEDAAKTPAREETARATFERAREILGDWEQPPNDAEPEPEPDA